MAPKTAQLKGCCAPEHGRDGKATLDGEVGAQTIALGTDTLKAQRLSSVHGDRLVLGYGCPIKLRRDCGAA